MKKQNMILVLLKSIRMIAQEDSAFADEEDEIARRQQHLLSLHHDLTSLTQQRKVILEHAAEHGDAAAVSEYGCSLWSISRWRRKAKSEAKRWQDSAGSGAAPSTLAVVGRYVLRPEIFDELATTERGSGGEIQLTDAIARRVRHGEVLALRFSGTRYDCGNKDGFLAANIAFARKEGLLPPRRAGDPDDLSFAG
jgi:UTP-glucose-1-phosphate uridylyltransferase